LSSRARGNVCSNIGIPRSDNSIEWGTKDFKVFQRLQAAYLSLIRNYRGAGTGVFIGGGIEILCGNNPGLKEVLGPLVGDFC